jgi:hypothetical protein
MSGEEAIGAPHLTTAKRRNKRQLVVGIIDELSKVLIMLLEKKYCHDFSIVKTLTSTTIAPK